MSLKKPMLLPSLPTDKDMLKHVQSFWKAIPELYATIANLGTGNGSGNVTGPNSAFNNEICVFNLASGKLIKGSGKVIADFANAIHTHTRSQLGLDNVLDIKFNINATSAPTYLDGVDRGYSVCSLWIDTASDKTYICVDASSGAAIWHIFGIDAGEAVAGENISAYRVVRPHTDGKIYICSSANSAFAELACGITFKAASKDEPVNFMTSGYFTESTWNWDTARPVFFDSLGRFTQTVPTSGFIQIVATPVTPTGLCVNIRNSVIL